MLLFTHRDRKTTASRRLRASARFRPAVDGLEGRALLSTVAPPGSAAAQVTAISAAQTPAAQVFQVRNGQLIAAATLNSQAVSVPVNAQVSATSLTLTIGPIAQSARGLRVEAPAFPVTLTPQDNQPLATSLRTLIAAQQGTGFNLQNLATGLNALIDQAEGLGSQTGSGSVLNLTGLNAQGRQIVATGTLLGQPFSRSATVGTSPGTSPRRPNLSLTLAPGNDTQQGIRVETPTIPLTVIAVPEFRNRNGNLLIQVARMLRRNPNINSRLVARVLAQLQG